MDATASTQMRQGQEGWQQLSNLQRSTSPGRPGSLPGDAEPPPVDLKHTEWQLKCTTRLGTGRHCNASLCHHAAQRFMTVSGHTCTGDHDVPGVD